MSQDGINDEISYGFIRNTRELGQVARAHRKQQGVTLKTIAGFGRLSPRFLSEFERGKETAEIGKVLKALHKLGLELAVLPRRYRAQTVEPLGPETPE